MTYQEWLEQKYIDWEKSQSGRQSYYNFAHYLDVNHTAMAQWMIGESFVQQKNYSRALREFLRLEVLYDFPTWQAAALFEAGKCHEQLGEWKQASELYDRIIKEFPEAPVLDDSRERLRNARERIKSKK